MTYTIITYVKGNDVAPEHGVGVWNFSGTLNEACLKARKAQVENGGVEQLTDVVVMTAFEGDLEPEF